jgi:ribosomal protein S18 acetylase RimI-like enzyme
LNCELRPTRPDDLDAILPLEHRAENHDLIGQWTREQHLESMARQDRAHWSIECAGRLCGYLIAYDVRATGFGIYIKRVAVDETSRGIGRRAIADFLDRVWAGSDAPLVTLAVRGHNARAKRCYDALGFTTWDLPPGERARMNAEVDVIPDDCLVMRVQRGD